MNEINSAIEGTLSNIESTESEIRALKEQKSKLVNSLLNDLNKSSEKNKKDLLEKLSSFIYIDDYTERLTRILNQSSVPLYRVASFERSLVQSTRRRQLHRYSPAWNLNNKRKAYSFIDDLGILRPEVYQEKTKFKNLTIRPGMVLKPENGSSSHGVYIIGEGGISYEVKTGNYFSSLEEVSNRIEELLKNKIVGSDSWFLEEFIGEFDKGICRPARDLKFYCFFGKVGFVLEVDRSGVARYCDWMPDGSPANTGLPNKNFIGDGFSSHEMDVASYVSKHIHEPFMRIDFLKCGKNFIFGEFTPRPGQFNYFNDSFDRYLGEMYLEAEGRLLEFLTKR
nr:ATP-grasp fold amidoligase family protein [uncultured Halomonas sp.]